MKCSPASFKRNSTFPVMSSLATGRTLAPSDISAWFTVEVYVLTFARDVPEKSVKVEFSIRDAFSSDVPI